VHHSDRGVQYVSIRYTERLADAGLEPSVGSVGDSYDNALAETINGLYKAEVIHRKPSWQRREDVEWATLNWVDWFIHRRLLGPSATSRQPKQKPPTIHRSLSTPKRRDSHQRVSGKAGAVQKTKTKLVRD
jgi:putative transposase